MADCEVKFLMSVTQLVFILLYQIQVVPSKPYMLQNIFLDKNNFIITTRLQWKFMILMLPKTGNLFHVLG